MIQQSKHTTTRRGRCEAEERQLKCICEAARIYFNVLILNLWIKEAYTDFKSLLLFNFDGTSHTKHTQGTR